MGAGRLTHGTGELAGAFLQQPDDLGLLRGGTAAAHHRGALARQLHELILVVLQTHLEDHASTHTYRTLYVILILIKKINDVLLCAVYLYLMCIVCVCPGQCLSACLSHLPLVSPLISPEHNRVSF